MTDPCAGCGLPECDLGCAPARRATRPFAAARVALEHGRAAAGLGLPYSARVEEIETLKARCTALARRVSELENKINALLQRGA